MSMATLERLILANAKLLFNNPKLTKNDLMEWSSGEIKPHEGEVTAFIGDPGVYVSIKTEKDRRGK